MEMQMQREIAAPAEAVWAVLGEGFGDLSWASDVESSSLEGSLQVGAVRTCRFPPNMFSKEGFVRETLRSFDRRTMSFSYEAHGMPAFIGRAINRWTIVPLGEDRCRVESRATVQPRGIAILIAPIMRIMLRRMGLRFLDELAEHVATASEAPACAT